MIKDIIQTQKNPGKIAADGTAMRKRDDELVLLSSRTSDKTLKTVKQVRARLHLRSRKVLKMSLYLLLRLMQALLRCGELCELLKNAGELAKKPGGGKRKRT
ncbi:hypothetical protein Nepgr_021776 [Nepenthes gracilis]|uniref:Uncharacterized protein n=1 Tax=Nepenthes gracilis TaxID=150966 RepID=A0AAD3XXI9_NEPGR|nr:hypothetical protein Nepgr_021776 [Nepenthes gracilis]